MRGRLAGPPLLTPEDDQAPQRTRRLHGLGLLDQADPVFDSFALRLAEITAAPWSMVNFVEEEGQFLAGLHWPSLAPADTAAAEEAGDSKPPRDADREQGRPADRRMSREHGYCPHVVVRRRALVLEDVRDYPRFAHNPLVDRYGVRSYLGAPLMDRGGLALGTVCVIDVAPRRWGKAGLETIKAMAAELTEEILRRDHGI